MAIVWRATDLQLERDVAIKIISDVLAGDPRFVARFEREARLAAGLNHPNLVKVFDFSVDSERPFLIMEFVGGGTLADARGRELDVDSLARELLEAVAHIHAAGILHRDIKPANVLLDDGGSPRLTDFGIARGEETSSLTQTGQVLGTLRYIAPEVAEGRPASVSSDLYSLGILLGELTGERSEALERLLGRLTALNADDRPASAGAALAELDPTRVLPNDDDPTVALGGESYATVRGQAPYSGVTYGRVRGQAPRFAMRLARSQAVAGAILLVTVLVIVVLAATGGDGGSGSTGVPGKDGAGAIQPAPAGAPANAQIDRLEQIVRSARRKP